MSVNYPYTDPDIAEGRYAKYAALVAQYEDSIEDTVESNEDVLDWEVNVSVKNGLAWTGIVAGGALAVILLGLLILAISTLLWAVVVFYGSMVVHWAFDSVPEATFVQAVGIGFVIAILQSILGRNTTVVNR